MEEVINVQLAILLGLLRTRYGDGRKVVGWAAIARYFSVDVVTVATTGDLWGDPQTETDYYKLFRIGDTLCGLLVLAGTDVYPNNLVRVCNREVIGEDVHAFHP